MEHCHQEKKFEKIEKALWFGNGEKPLMALPRQMDEMSKSLEKIESNVAILLEFQTKVEIEKQQTEISKSKLEKKEKEFGKKNMALIILAASTILGLLTLVVTLMINLNLPKEDQQKSFNELIQEYESHPRSIEVTDSIK